MLSLFLAGCEKAPDPDPFYPAVPNPDPAKAKDEDEIRIAAFRQMFKGASAGETCFIAFREAGIAGWIYPSDQFMSRLADPRLTLRKVTETRPPEWGEPVIPGYIYSVQIEWLAPDRAKVRAELTRGPLSGGGFEYLIVRQAGAWAYKETVGSWAN